MSMDKVIIVVSYTITIAIICVLIYFMPMLFIGLILGIVIGSNTDKIKQWVEDDTDLDL